MDRAPVTFDGNEAVASVAYRASEVIAIYPITPSSPMAEWAGQWATEEKPNAWGTVPSVVEMQSEGGAAGAIHGALQCGALTTTFTSSQGLLLMIPNMYKIAGELTAAVIHVAARSLATQALSIFCDHSDVMSARATGFAFLCSNSVQEASDFALISHAATLESRVPFLHFFDGFRTSHEVMKVESLETDDIRALLDDGLVRAHRERALTPDRPVLRGATQDPDVYFQARESVNPYYLACPDIVQNAMDRFAVITGRAYHLFDYVGAADAQRVIVLMGSGCGAAEEAVEALVARGEKVGLLKCHLYRPFAVERFLAALPATVRTIGVLDRTKEPGAIGEPLYLDVVAAISEGLGMDCCPFKQAPRVVGGRYGLSSKEFTPAMIKGIFDELAKDRPRNHFTVGIVDDVTHTHLDYDPAFSTEDPDTVRAIFYGLGSDGTVGANKNSIKIIGEETENHAQGYFVYDSKKSGSMTTSHLRFGPRPIRSTYLITRANFVACHQFGLLERADVLKAAQPGATFLLNSHYPATEVWDHLPQTVQEQIIAKQLKFYVIDGYKIAQQAGMGDRINTIMQTCFFAISGVLPREQAIEAIKYAIVKTYGKRGEAVVQKNCAAVDATLAHLEEVSVPRHVTSSRPMYVPAANSPSEFVRNFTAKIIAGKGDSLPVSAMVADGTYPTGTAACEKRNISPEIPVWDSDICIQCGKCVMVCPHAVIRGKIYEPALGATAPPTFKSAAAKWRPSSGIGPDMRFTLQVAPEDCTGCGLCVEVCPVKNKSETRFKAINMMPQAPLRESEAANWDFFLKIPDPSREKLNLGAVKDMQLLTPLFEFSGACAGCGETPYLKLLSQLFGDRTVIANATGCSSIYGGNLPTTPWTTNREGRGPAWSNSLFEDNAEFGLGMRIAINKHDEHARELLVRLGSTVGDELVQGILSADQSAEAGIEAQRQRVRALREKLIGLLSGSGTFAKSAGHDSADAKDLLGLADSLVKKCVWIVGGDGWAYDIGYGGLDHVLASGHNVNVLVLDTEVYSNTGGQMSKSTPRGAVAKFAAGGKNMPKKDLAMMAMNYQGVYVARVAIGGNDSQTVRAFQEAEAYNGPSLIIAYSHCIAHGYDLIHGLSQQKAAVQSGYWPLFRYHPDSAAKGENPMHLDSAAPTLPLKKYAYNEGRYTMLAHAKPELAGQLLTLAEADVARRWRLYENMAAADHVYMVPGNGAQKP
jgi:pyruvate-ferredoxin/flavodoxin oxidoreductase